MTDSDNSPQAAICRRFADNLIVARGRLDLGQEEIAERSGLHRTQISLLERGHRQPRVDTIVRLAGAVEVKPCELLAGMAWHLRHEEEQEAATYLDREGRA